MDEKDSMTPDTIPQSTPVDGTFRPEGRTAGRSSSAWPPSRPSRWSRVACADTGRTRTSVSMAREACQSAVTDLGKTVKSYKALLGADSTTPR